MRRVSEVISMSSIRRFRVKHRVSPFKNRGSSLAPPHFLNDLTVRYSIPSGDSRYNSSVESSGSGSPPQQRRHDSDSRALSHPESFSGSNRSVTVSDGGSTETITLPKRRGSIRRSSLDQAVDVSRLLRTVEELFRSVRLLFHPSYPVTQQFLPQPALTTAVAESSTSAAKSPLPPPPSSPSVLTSSDNNNNNNISEEDEMVSNRSSSISSTRTSSSLARTATTNGGENLPESADAASNLARQAARDSMRKMQLVGGGHESEMRAPVTALVDNFSPTHKRQVGGQINSNGPNNLLNNSRIEKEPKPSQKPTRIIPSYGELFARNQQFDCRYQPVQPVLIENFASTFCNTCAYLFAALFVAIPIYLFLLILTPFASVVRLIQRVCCFECSSASRMSALESGFMYDLFAADSICTSLVVLDTKHVSDPVAALKQALLSEILNKRSGGGSSSGSGESSSNNRHHRVYQRLRQKHVRMRCDMFGWRDDDAFSIDRHFIPNYRQRFANISELEDCLADISRQPLTPDQSPWEIRFVENFGGPGSILLIFRHHLSLADGVSLVNVLHAAFAKNGRNPYNGQFDDWPPMHHLFTGSTYDFNCLRSALVGPITVLAAHGVEPHPLNQAGVADPPDTVSTDFDRYEMILSDPMNLDCCTVIKQITHSSLNEIFLSLLAGSIRCYLQHHAIANPPDLKALLPVNLSRSPYPDSVGSGRSNNANSEFCPKLQNKYSFAFFKLPVSTEGAVPRLWAVRKRYENFSNASDTASIDTSLKLADLVTAPPSYQSFARQMFASGFCLVSNLAGSPSQLSIGGCQVSALMFWMPPPAGCNLSFSLFSYRNEVRLGVMARSALMPRPKILTAEFTRQLQQLYEQVAVRTLSMELDTLFPDFTLSAMTQSTIQELEHILVPIQSQLVQLKAQIDAGDRSLVTLQQIRRLQDRFRCLLIKIKQQQAIRGVALSSSSSVAVATGSSTTTATTTALAAGATGVGSADSASAALARNSQSSAAAAFVLQSPSRQNNKRILKTQPLPPVYQVPAQMHSIAQMQAHMKLSPTTSYNDAPKKKTSQPELRQQLSDQQQQQKPRSMSGGVTLRSSESMV